MKIVVNVRGRNKDTYNYIKQSVPLLSDEDMLLLGMRLLADSMSGNKKSDTKFVESLKSLI